MPPQLRYSSDTVDAQTDAVCLLLDNGYLQIYDGSQPADGDSGILGSTLLVELRFGNPAFRPSSGGVALANEIPAAIATQTGNAAWLRTLQADHNTVVFDGDINTSDAVLNLDRTLIQQNASVIIADFSYVSPKTL